MIMSHSNIDTDPTITAESYAKQLGATIVANKHYMSAENWPTTMAATKFFDWLRSRGYLVTMKDTYSNALQIRYAMPGPRIAVEVQQAIALGKDVTADAVK